MDIIPASARATNRVNEAWFTGTVWQDPIVDTPAPSRVRGARVTFEPGARTAWHTHPLGQTLIVLSGTGRAQVWGGPVRDLKSGDTVWIPPGEKHWHGATPTQGMVHIAIHEALDGVHVTWMEKVTDAEYARPPSA
jgi:quercetin dioxygenase-like cupin family protein